MPENPEPNPIGNHSKNGRRVRLPIKGVLLCALLLLPDGLFKAQARSGDRPLPVSLHVAVTDRNGKPVENLQAADFEVFEKKKLQRVTQVRFERDVPVSLGVLVDVSKSMEGDGIRLALKLLKRLATHLESPDELFVNAFSGESQELLDYMAPEDYLEEAIENLSTGGRPHMGQALDLALIKLRDASNANRAVLFISAGRDIAGPATLDHIARHRRPVYALGIEGAISFRTRLKTLNVKGSALNVYADHSGGSVYFVETEEEAAGPLEMLPYQLKNRFVLQYLSTHPKRDGKFRKIRVAVSQPQYQVRYPKKYQAPRR
jgi:Ca-activated chloride channel family protein